MILIANACRYNYDFVHQKSPINAEILLFLVTPNTPNYLLQMQVQMIFLPIVREGRYG